MTSPLRWCFIFSFQFILKYIFKLGIFIARRVFARAFMRLGGYTYA